jgi:hypothetical protein
LQRLITEMETSTENEPTIAAIADRLRSVLLRRPSGNADKMSQAGEELGVSFSQIEDLLHRRDKLFDPGLLVDLVAIVVRDDAVDPTWLLTGGYDRETHQGALALAEENGGRPLRDSALRSFVNQQWGALRNSLRAPLQFCDVS